MFEIYHRSRLQLTSSIIHLFYVIHTYCILPIHIKTSVQFCIKRCIIHYHASLIVGLLYCIVLHFVLICCWCKVHILRNKDCQLSSQQLAVSDVCPSPPPPLPRGLPFPATPSKSISLSIRKDYAKIQGGITLGKHSHLLTPPHHILGHSTLCSLWAYQLLQCSVQSIRQSCFATAVTPSLPRTCGRSPRARD